MDIIRKIIRESLREVFTDNDENSEEVENVCELMETDLMNQEFFKNYMDESSTTELGSQSTNDRTGDKEVWIEIISPKPMALQALDADYKTFAHAFEQWAHAHGLYNPEILSGDNDIMFQVTV